MMQHFKPHFLMMLATVLVVSMLCACHGGKESNMADDIKASVAEQLQGDTSSIVKEELAVLDTMSASSPDKATEIYKTINKLIYNLYHRGDASKSLRLSRGMLETMKKRSDLSVADKRQLLNLYVILGTTFSESGMPSISLDYYTKGLESCTDSTDLKYKAMFYNNIGVLYAQADILDCASEYFNKSLAINLRHNIHHEAYLNYANLAELYALRGELDKAQQAAQQALDHLNAEKYPLSLAKMRVQQGEIFTRQKQYDVALLRYNSALRQYLSSDFLSGAMETQLKLSDLYLKRGMIDSALYYAEITLDKARSTYQPEIAVEALSQLSAVKDAAGDKTEGMDLLRESMALSDSLRKAETRLRLNNWEVLGPEMFPVNDRHPNSHNSPTLIILLFISLGIIVALSVVIFLSRRKRRRQKESDLAAIDRLEKEKNGLNRELTALSLDKIKISEGMESVREQLKIILLELNPRETTKKEHIRQLLSKLEALGSEKGDEEFKHFFERVHPDFYKVLSERWPDLTQRDLRLCAFIYLGLNTKEIASLTYREVRSVESARNRLRKKLGIENSDDLHSFLQEQLEEKQNSFSKT
ncbi:MAG: hypothetical protein K2M69_09030 [Muribaculaceae bacterium]|nr:hypothetical protein [Muribaculaceae bacterium]